LPLGKKIMNKNLLSFLSAIDPIFLPSKHQKKIFMAVPKNTPQEKFAQKNFSKNRLISFKINKKEIPDTDKIIKNSNFNKLLKKHQIDSYLLPHRQNSIVGSWAKKNNISLIGPKPKIQKQLENKIYFDKLLKQLKISSPHTLKNETDLKNYPPQKPLVVQESSSYGFFGTKLYAQKSEYFKAIKHKKVNFKNTLIREYVTGPTVGVSLFINQDGRYFCSAPRLQCFIYQNGFPASFTGIQWLKNTDLNDLANKRLNKTLKRLVSLLKQEKFYGLANFDIIISPKKVYVIECNPRLSSATPQIFFQPQLVANLDAWQFLIATFTKEKSTLKNNKLLPKSNYAGALLDFDAEKEIKIKNLPLLGVYEYQKGEIKYLGAEISKLRNGKNKFFLYHDLPGKIKSSDFTVWTIISNFALYHPLTGQLNFAGNEIYRHFKEKVIQ